MGKQSIYFREAEYKNYLATLENCKSYYQSLLDELIRVDLKPKTIDELRAFACLTEDEIKQHLTRDVQEMTWSGFKLSKQKTIELLELPSLEKLNELRAEMHKYHEGYQYLTIKGNSVVLAQKELDTIKSRYSFFAETNDELKLFNAYKEAVQAMNDFNLAYFKLRGGSIVHENIPVNKLFRLEQGLNPILNELDTVTSYERYKDPSVSINNDLLVRLFPHK